MLGVVSIWTVLFLAVFGWYAVRWFVAWRFRQNFQLRRITITTSDENAWRSVVVDFVDMLAFTQHAVLEPFPGVPDWPGLYYLRRLDGPQWEASPHTTYLKHNVADLRKWLANKKHTDVEEEQKELDALTSGKSRWEEWGWGSQVEPAYQIFLRHYRPTSEDDDARHKVPSLVDAYDTAWKREADGAEAFERGMTRGLAKAAGES